MIWHFLSRGPKSAPGLHQCGPSITCTLPRCSPTVRPWSLSLVKCWIRKLFLYYDCGKTSEVLHWLCLGLPWGFARCYIKSTQHSNMLYVPSHPRDSALGPTTYPRATLKCQPKLSAQISRQCETDSLLTQTVNEGTQSRCFEWSDGNDLSDFVFHLFPVIGEQFTL